MRLTRAFRAVGEGTYIDLVTGNQGNSFTQQNGKGIPQFAPNFTVYVLPPNVVCLYSEDRKFLLHGELYCALASAIAKGGKSFRELVRELEPDFPSDKILEALTRLLDRHYVIPTSRSSNGPRPGSRRVSRRRGRRTSHTSVACLPAAGMSRLPFI